MDVAFKSMILCGLFFFHPAAVTLIGRGYYSLIGLNDIEAPVRFNMMLQPAILLPLVLIAWRLSRGDRDRLSRAFRQKYGLGFALFLLFGGATISFIANINTELVALVYWSGFAAGLLVYIALSRLTLEEPVIERLFIALAAGSLLSLVLGYLTFYDQWGFPSVSNAFAVQADRFNAKFNLYTEATFGNPGNTAAFLTLVGPPLLWLTFDSMQRLRARALYAICFLFVLLNLLIVQERAAFIAFGLAVVLVLRFRMDSRLGYALVAVLMLIGAYTMQAYAPETADLVARRFVPVMIVDSDADASVASRQDAIREGAELAWAAWPIGIGPGAGLARHSLESAHQFNIQEMMEAGVLGLIGSVWCCIALAMFVWRVLAIGPGTRINRLRFTMAIGPAVYLLYGVLANIPTALSYINTWVVLALAMMAMAPGISRAEIVASQRSTFKRAVRSAFVNLRIGAAPAHGYGPSPAFHDRLFGRRN